MSFLVIEATKTGIQIIAISPTMELAEECVHSQVKQLKEAWATPEAEFMLKIAGNYIAKPKKGDYRHVIVECGPMREVDFA